MMEQHRQPALSAGQLHRCAGVLLATAAGDALGAGYEFGPPLEAEAPVGMIGDHRFAPGEWTDDTSMALVIAQLAADGADLLDPQVQGRIGAEWREWSRTAPDVGIQTAAVLTSAEAQPGGVTADALFRASREHHQRQGRSGGNGSLMRTAPVALAHLHDEPGLLRAAAELSRLTHHDPEAAEACQLWCLAIRRAVLTGELDIRSGLQALPADRAAVWAERLDVAESARPQEFRHNGWVVEALQAAWCAISTTEIPAADPAGGQPAHHLVLALEAAVRGGRDADTVAAIAGGLLGARWGASAVPARWRRMLHGWPGLRSRDLIRLGVLGATGWRHEPTRWPAAARVDYSGYGHTTALAAHPADPDVLLGGVGVLGDLPGHVDAVVSLCRLGRDEVPAAGVRVSDHVEVWLVDTDEPSANPHLDFVLRDTVAVIRRLRDEGRTVLLHCVQAQSRTPAVAALYGAALTGRTTTQELADIQRVLPGAEPNPAFQRALQRADQP